METFKNRIENAIRKSLALDVVAKIDVQENDELLQIWDRAEEHSEVTSVNYGGGELLVQGLRDSERWAFRVLASSS